MTTLATAVLGSDEDDDDYVPEEDIAAQKAAAAEASRVAKQGQGAELLFMGRAGGSASRRTAAKGTAPADTEAQAQLVGKAATRKRRMDAMWAELNGGAAPSAPQKEAAAAASGQSPAAAASATEPVAKAAKRKRKRDALMAQLLGGGGGSAQSGALSFKAKKKKKGLVEFKLPGPPPAKKKKHGSQAGSAAVDTVQGTAAASSGTGLIKSAKVSVTQTVKFAGAMTSVTQTFQAGTKAANDALRAAAEREKAESAGGLDGVLHAIKKPSSVSTMTKSSVDWDAFKEESNLADELEQATKDGYLQRQDFLTRCDVRQFEQEKAQRNLDRAKRDKR